MLAAVHVDNATAMVVKVAWLLLHCFFTVRSTFRAGVDAIFRLLGLAFLEPRRGLLYALRKLQRLMVGVIAAVVITPLHPTAPAASAFPDRITVTQEPDTLRRSGEHHLPLVR